MATPSEGVDAAREQGEEEAAIVVIGEQRKTADDAAGVDVKDSVG
jgi:hypothetical protein